MPGAALNGELLTLEEFIDVALHAGTTRLWLDVKRIEVGGATQHGRVGRGCSRACEIIREKKAQHYREFIVGMPPSGRMLFTAQLAGIKVGWMSYSAPSAYKSISIRGRASLLELFGGAGFEPASRCRAHRRRCRAELYNADTDPEMTYV
ncbi:MAG: hypothetical protein ACLRMJ_09985 [Alistipes finegoldii]